MRDFEILTHLGVYQERQNERAPLLLRIDYTERVTIEHNEDSWPESDEQVYNFKSPKLHKSRFEKERILEIDG